MDVFMHSVVWCVLSQIEVVGFGANTGGLRKGGIGDEETNWREQHGLKN